MADITEYVDLTIIIADAALEAPNFGAMLFVGESPSGDAGFHEIGANGAGLQEYVNGLSGATSDTIYKMLSAGVAQAPHTSDFFWYNGKNHNTVALELVPQGPFTEGKVYKVTVNGVVASVVASDSADATEISTALHTLIDAITGVDSTDATGSVTLLASSVAETDIFLDAYKPADIEVTETSTTANVITEDFDAALLANPNFYGIVIEMQDATNIAAAAAWVETNKKMLLVKVRDSEALAGLGVVATLKAAGYHRTAVFYTEDDDSRGDAALLARQLALDPGASDFQFKRLAGVTASQLTGGEISGVKDENGITYTPTSGVAFTDNGVAASGRPLSVTRNVDFLEARINQLIMTEFANSEIVILGASGIAKMEKALRTAMSEAEALNILLPGWTVTVPKASDISAADKAVGLMKGFAFSGQLAVATRKIQINGTLS